MVTGAACGLGRATARLVAGEGARVSAVDRDADGIKDTVEAIILAGGSAIAVVADLGDAVAAREAVDETVRQLGRLDVLVNAAGVLDVEPLLEVTEQSWDRTFAVNARGLFACPEAALWLASPAAGYATGGRLNVSGGLELD